MRAVFVACAVLWSASIAVAQPRNLDLRIVFIDTGHFAEIQPIQARQDAISAMVDSLAKIESEEPARETVLLYERRSSVEVYPGVDTSRDLSRQSVFKDLLDQVRTGAGQASAGFELVDLRDRFHDVINNTGMVQGRGIWPFNRKQPVPKRVALHVFAQDWVTENEDSAGRVVETERPAICVHEGRNAQKLLPGYVDLEFFFLPPLGGLAPTDAGMSALSTVVTGSPDRRSNVLTRGVAMPECPFGDSIVMVPFGGAGLNGSTAVCDVPGALAHRSRVTACRNLPQFAGVASHLDTTPVHLVADPKAPALRDLLLSGPARLPGMDVVAHIGSFALAPGATPTPHRQAPARYAARLELQSQAGCRPGGAFDMKLSDPSSPRDALIVSVSRHYCQSASLPLAELDLR